MEALGCFWLENMCLGKVGTVPCLHVPRCPELPSFWDRKRRARRRSALRSEPPSYSGLRASRTSLQI